MCVRACVGACMRNVHVCVHACVLLYMYMHVVLCTVHHNVDTFLPFLFLPVKVKGLEEELEESEKTVRNLQTQLAGYVKSEAAQKQHMIQEVAGQMATSAITKGTYT